MGIDYTFYLRVGYSLNQDDVMKPYSTVREARFHYEDRFDSRTGMKLKPVKVMDEVGGLYLSVEYQGETYEDLWGLVNETDFFCKKFDCEVSIPFDSSGEEDGINFYLELPKSEPIGCGRVGIYGTDIPISWIEQNKEKLSELKDKLEKEFGVDVGEPKIFVESWIG